MKFLSGVAENGEGSAALPLTRRPDRLMSRRMANLLAVAGAAAVLATIAAKVVFPSAPSPVMTPTDDAPVEIAISEDSSTAPTPVPTDHPISQVRRDYAIDLHELRGLPLDAAPGTPMELWVAWDQGIAEGPQMQRLVKTVTLSRFIEPVTHQGPMVVVLSVPEKAMRAVMYGDLYGSFSVALPTG